MSICDGCGGEYGHSPNCPEARAYAAASHARHEATAPLNTEIERLKGANRRLRTSMMDVLSSSSHDEAKRIAKRSLAEG